MVNRNIFFVAVGGRNHTPGGVLDAILLEDGISGLMLEDGISAILLENEQAASSWVLTNGTHAAHLDIDFVNDQAWVYPSEEAISDVLTCDRNTPSLAYYTKADGTLTTFAPDTLRYGTNGLLVEEARTNLFLQSQTFNNASWNLGNSTVGTNVIAAPDGTVTADSLIPNAGTSQPYFNQQPSVSNTTAYTYSFYVKNGTLGNNWISIDIGLGSAFRAWFNLATGVAGSTAGSPTSTAITALADGWYRIEMTLTTDGTVSDSYLVARGADGSTANITGDGTSPAYYVWGAQLEAGAFATSYIPTTTASVTRAADVVTFASQSWLLDNGTGTYYTQARSAATAITANARIWGATTKTTISIDGQNDNKAVTYNGSSALTATAGSGLWSTGSKAAAACDGTTRTLCMNAGTVTSDSASFGTIGTIYIGSDNGSGNFFCGYIPRLSYWPRRLSNSDLQTLTT